MSVLANELVTPPCRSLQRRKGAWSMEHGACLPVVASSAEREHGAWSMEHGFKPTYFWELVLFLEIMSNPEEVE